MNFSCGKINYETVKMKMLFEPDEIGASLFSSVGVVDFLEKFMQP